MVDSVAEIRGRIAHFCKIDVAANDRKENSRLGLTLSLPAGKAQSIKFNYSRGATARLGSNFTTYGIGWQYTWLD